MSKSQLNLCIETVSGKTVDPSNPSYKDLSVEDIAWSLSRIPRFAGHTITEVPYNVAQHSVYVSQLLENFLYGRLDDKLQPEVQLSMKQYLPKGAVNTADICIKALFHDGHEGYTGDIPSPIKKIPEISDKLKEVELKLDKAIYELLNVSMPTDDERNLIKWCDKIAQAVEAYQFMPSRGLEWDLPKPSLIMLQSFPSPMSPLDSYKAFIKRYQNLTLE